MTICLEEEEGGKGKEIEWKRRLGLDHRMRERLRHTHVVGQLAICREGKGETIIVGVPRQISDVYFSSHVDELVQVETYNDESKNQIRTQNSMTMTLFPRFTIRRLSLYSQEKKRERVLLRVLKGRLVR